MAEETGIEAQIGGLLRRWGRKKAKIEENVTVTGKAKQHTFDFMLRPRHGEPITVSVLHPTAGALSAAERFGFKAQDLRETAAGKGKRVAVEARSDTWSADARRIVALFADRVIEVPSGEAANFAELSGVLDDLAA